MNNISHADSLVPASAPDVSEPDPIRRSDAVALRKEITSSEVEKALTDRDPAVRAAALWRLNVHLTPAQIDRALDDPAPAVRIRAVLRPEPLSPSQVEHALNDKNSLVQQAAALRQLRGH